MVFKTVTSQVNFPEMEKGILKWWYESGVVGYYLHKNDKSKEKFSFLDGPITANNPMGVHHAWGRTYKDLWQRFNTLLGKKQRYQNGFDCQGLWVEVEVEKELGFKNKKDIEKYGVANFVNKCKERVLKYSAIQTEQSKRLGNFMNWENSYFTMSDKNNYAIWRFLKVCFDRGWIYKGHDSVPWCPRCETAISQHEILTEDYKELVHESIIIEFPVIGREKEYLLVWTTTPWTLPANIAVAVDEKLDYALVSGKSGDLFWVAKDLVQRVFKGKYQKIEKTAKGSELVGLRYSSPFDDLEAVKTVAMENPEKFHTVIPTDDLIMPISGAEGTGLVHTAVSAGEEDFKLGQKLGLPLIPIIADNADYLAGLGEFSGKNAKKNPRVILDYLDQKDKSGTNCVFEIFAYKHRYPACWRCKEELVWKVADEWYIAMDKVDPTDKKRRNLRQQMMDVAKEITWLPAFGLDRELDWLKNMHDWLISKKNRYWGLALPIYECDKCGHFEVLGSRDDLKDRAISGWDKFAGKSPHKPWIDEVKIKCSQCEEVVSRIPDVGNPWLDAGIVPFSTMPHDFFPADFVTESFPGQFKNWFYSLIAMSTVLTKSNPFKTVLGYASLLAEDGRPMHKSWGNSIDFNEGADKIGVDVMRWMYASHQPANNLLFGYKIADVTRRRFHLMLWNTFNFFITYASIDKYQPEPLRAGGGSLSVLDKWILERLDETTDRVTDSLKNFDSLNSTQEIELFVNDLSLWYVRRSRDRVGPSADNKQDKKAFYHTLNFIFKTLSILLSPFTPFLAEEMYQNIKLGDKSYSDPNTSVHLESWPDKRIRLTLTSQLTTQMKLARQVVEKALAIRKEKSIKVRQPLASLTYTLEAKLDDSIEQLVADEINVKKIVWTKGEDLRAVLDLNLDSKLVAEGTARELIRSLQGLRKEKGLKLDEKVAAQAPDWPEVFADYIKKQALLSSLTRGKTLKLF